MASYFLQAFTESTQGKISARLSVHWAICEVSVASFTTVQQCQQEFLLIGNCQLCQNTKRVFFSIFNEEAFQEFKHFFSCLMEEFSSRQKFVLFPIRGSCHCVICCWALLPLKALLSHHKKWPTPLSLPSVQCQEPGVNPTLNYCKGCFCTAWNSWTFTPGRGSRGEF